ncbi:hypothetical protein Bca52824_075035 [Brassica carinata]|uniref:Uncharacterized protein n=1 Tax=Brassica carinata TaxID=52824 RepID=A0A8X7TXK3_BRACI|nr:hypothetical protein Bca52824_075035 [Brassica carinata]
MVDEFLMTTTPFSGVAPPDLSSVLASSAYRHVLTFHQISSILWSLPIRDPAYQPFPTQFVSSSPNLLLVSHPLGMLDFVSTVFMFLSDKYLLSKPSVCHTAYAVCFLIISSGDPASGVLKPLCHPIVTLTVSSLHPDDLKYAGDVNNISRPKS